MSGADREYAKLMAQIQARDSVRGSAPMRDKAARREEIMAARFEAARNPLMPANLIAAMELSGVQRAAGDKARSAIIGDAQRRPRGAGGGYDKAQSRTKGVASARRFESKLAQAAEYIGREREAPKGQGRGYANQYQRASERITSDVPRLTAGEIAQIAAPAAGALAAELTGAPMLMRGRGETALARDAAYMAGQDEEALARTRQGALQELGGAATLASNAALAAPLVAKGGQAIGGLAGKIDRAIDAMPDEADRVRAAARASEDAMRQRQALNAQREAENAALIDKPSPDGPDLPPIAIPRDAASVKDMPAHRSGYRPTQWRGSVLGSGPVPRSEIKKAIKAGDDLGYAREHTIGLVKFGPEGMTPEARMARAAEQGYDETVYHGTRRQLAGGGMTPGPTGSLGPAVYTSPRPEIASRFAIDGQVIPLLRRGRKAGPENQNVDALLKGWRYPSQGDDARNIEALRRDGFTAATAPFPDATGVDIDGASVAVYDPASLRSPQATFNPSRINRRSILGSGPVPKGQGARKAIAGQSVAENTGATNREQTWSWDDVGLETPPSGNQNRASRMQERRAAGLGPGRGFSRDTRDLILGYNDADSFDEIAEIMGYGYAGAARSRISHTRKRLQQIAEKGGDRALSLVARDLDLDPVELSTFMQTQRAPRKGTYTRVRQAVESIPREAGAPVDVDAVMAALAQAGDDIPREKVNATLRNLIWRGKLDAPPHASGRPVSKNQEAIIAAGQKGLSVPDIARRLDVPENTVRSILARAEVTPARALTRGDLNAERNARVLDLIASGKSFSEVAREAGISRSAVSGIAARANKRPPTAPAGPLQSVADRTGVALDKVRAISARAKDAGEDIASIGGGLVIPATAAGVGASMLAAPEARADGFDPWEVDLDMPPDEERLAGQERALKSALGGAAGVGLGLLARGRMPVGNAGRIAAPVIGGAGGAGIANAAAGGSPDEALAAGGLGAIGGLAGLGAMKLGGDEAVTALLDDADRFRHMRPAFDEYAQTLRAGPDMRNPRAVFERMPAAQKFAAMSEDFERSGLRPRPMVETAASANIMGKLVDAPPRSPLEPQARAMQSAARQMGAVRERRALPAPEPKRQLPARAYRGPSRGEGGVETVEIPRMGSVGGAVEVFRNPTRAQVERLLADQSKARRTGGGPVNLAWGVDEAGDFVVFDGNRGLHDPIEQAAGLSFVERGRAESADDLQRAFREWREYRASEGSIPADEAVTRAARGPGDTRTMPRALEADFRKAETDAARAGVKGDYARWLRRQGRGDEAEKVSALPNGEWSAMMRARLMMDRAPQAPANPVPARRAIGPRLRPRIGAGDQILPYDQRGAFPSSWDALVDAPRRQTTWEEARGASGPLDKFVAEPPPKRGSVMTPMQKVKVGDLKRAADLAGVDAARLNGAQTRQALAQKLKTMPKNERDALLQTWRKNGIPLSIAVGTVGGLAGREAPPREAASR